MEVKTIRINTKTGSGRRQLEKMLKQGWTITNTVVQNPWTRFVLAPVGDLYTFTKP